MSNFIGIKLKLKKILESLNNNFLYIKLGGSRSLTFIKNPADYDIIVVSKNEEQRTACVNLFNNLYSNEHLRRLYKLDFHFTTIDHENEFLVNTIYPYFAQKTDPLYIVVKDYLEDYKPIEYFLSKKPEIIQNYKKIITGKSTINSSSKYKHKFWYYAYTTLCIFKNKSYNLTEEQINDINILHDRQEKDLEKRQQLINNIINYIIEYQGE